MSWVAAAPGQSRVTRALRALRSVPTPIAYAAAVVLPLLVLPLGVFAEHPHEVAAGRLYILVVAVVAFLLGLGPALVATVVSFAGLTYYFTPRTHSFRITNLDDLASLAVFLVTALVISELLFRGETGHREAAAARERAERLQEVTAALVEAHTTQDVLDVMLEQGVEASKASRGAVALLSPDGQTLEIKAWLNYPASLVHDFSRVPLAADAPHAEVTRTSVPVFLGSRAERDSRYPSLVERKEETFAVAALPLVGPSRTLGALVLSFDENRHFAREERVLLEAIAHQCAQALERAELLEAEAEARRELALQKAILEAEGDASDDGILLVSPEGQMLSFNRRFVELWDLPPDVVASRSDTAALNAIESKLSDPQEFYDRAMHLYANPDERSRDEIDLMDGRIVERYSAPVRSPEGELYGRVWYFRDITHIRRAQEIASVLAAASDLLSSTSEVEVVLQLVVRLAVPRLLGVCTLYLLDENVSPRLAAVAHWDPEREEAIRDLRRRHPAGTHGAVTRALETKEKVLVTAPDGETHRLTGNDGEQLELEPFATRETMMIPLVAHGLTYGVLGIGTVPRRSRLTPQKQEFAEELARRIAIALDNARLYAEAERRGDAARSLEHVGDGVLLLDGEGRLRYWNPAAADLFGLDDAKLGLPMGELFEGWSSLAEHLGEAGGETRTLPLQLDGGERWVSISAVSFGDGSVYALRDVTEERTLEGMRAEFVSTASHELRTPLTAVYGAARTLLRDDVPLSDEHQRSFLTMIAAESERLARIVNDILLASSLDANSIEIATEPCDVAGLVESVVYSARMRAPEAISLTQELPLDGPVYAECDEEKVRQVLVNLVDNAIKYSPDGGEVEVSVSRADGMVRFEVRDRGLGVPAAQRERIFDKFMRLDPNLRRGIGGTGLGLYICRELVRRMGGQIWVDGRDGAGSIFYLELPASASSASK